LNGEKEAVQYGPISKIAQGLRVLVVEDNPDQRFILATYLRAVNAQVVSAENGIEALDQIDKKTFDLILMDLQMPKMDGHQAVKKIRELGYRMPVVALTAHAMVDEQEECLSNGFNLHLSKPIDRELLLRSISMLMSHPC
jgi:CheY-like chemotaxis protein